MDREHNVDRSMRSARVPQERQAGFPGVRHSSFRYSWDSVDPYLPSKKCILEVGQSEHEAGTGKKPEQGGS